MSSEEAYNEALRRINRAEREESTHLGLSELRLRSLPPEITGLTTLTTLALHENQLSSLPPEIGNLTNLTTLRLSNNQLSSLPPEIGKLIKLITLKFYGNQLSSLPPEIGKLTELRQLDLDNNRLIELPRQLFDLDLKVLWVSGEGGLDLGRNPLEVPPIEVAEQGLEAVRAYYDEIEQEDTTQLFEAKLLIVGQGGVGKTYLMNRLIDNEVPETATTEGIDINRWMIKIKQTDQFRVNFWDFGGQAIYHATHQFFLTKRSLYLFVWEARTDADLVNFDYWLNTIKILSDNSPVVVIQNKIDERKKAINQEGWKKRFPKIVDYHNVSAIAGTGIDALKTAIIREIEQLPHIGDLLPKRWMDIRRELEGLDENFIPYSRYQEICATYEMDEVQTDRLSEYYHDLGVFLHFKYNPILRNTIFLKPEWATNAVYKVTDNQQVIDAYGKFHFDDLETIWQDKEEFPLEKHLELVELMKSFELCFKLPTGPEYIIPELLRANQPDFGWDYTQNLRFKYVYDFMPAGVMTRFIVRTHDMIKNDLYWKDGVILTWEKTDALIVKTDNRVIEVWIAGDDKKTLLGMIRQNMDYINSPFSNLELHEMVPCPCSECSGNPEPHFYRYQTMQKAREKGRRSIECQRSFEQVSINKLLGEIGPKAPDRQRIKVFLASSNELKEERDQVALLISKENRRPRAQNIFLDLVTWEEKKKTFHKNRFQERLNDELLECDVAIFLFFKKIGPFTKEEFDVAFEHFKAGNKPRHLFVFFKSEKVEYAEIDLAEAQKVQALKKEIEDAEQIYARFESDAELILQLKNQLELIIPEMV